MSSGNMENRLFTTVAQTIDSQCPWLRVTSTHEYQIYYIRQDIYNRSTARRCITIEVASSRSGYTAGWRWQITEPELDKALGEMTKHSLELKRRCRKFALTEKDVEELVKRASYGVIDLYVAGANSRLAN